MKQNYLFKKQQQNYTFKLNFELFRHNFYSNKIK